MVLVPELLKLTVSEPPPLWLFADPQTETTQRSVDACHYKKQLIRIANISHLKMLINLEHLRVETDLTYSNSGTVDSLALGQCVLMLFLPFPEPLTAARLLQRRDRFLADSWANQSDPVCILVV